MNKNYAIHQKHFISSNIDLKTRLKRFHKLYPALKDHTTLYCYSINNRLPSVLVFYPGEDRVDEYESFDLKLVSSYYHVGIKQLENCISFFQGSILVPTFNRYGLNITFHFSLTLVQPDGKDQVLSFRDNEINQHMIEFYDSTQSKKHHFVGHDHLAIYTHLFQQYDFKATREEWGSKLSFTNKGNHIEIGYNQYSEQAAHSDLKKELIFQKQMKDNQQTISFFLNYDDLILSRKYVKHCINLIKKMLLAKDIRDITFDIEKNHYFLQWLVEESSETLSDVSSN